MLSPVSCCLISVRLVVEEAAADDEPTTPSDDDVDLGIEVDEHQEGDRRCIENILNYTEEAKGKTTCRGAPDSSISSFSSSGGIQDKYSSILL